MLILLMFNINLLKQIALRDSIEMVVELDIFSSEAETFVFFQF